MKTFRRGLHGVSYRSKLGRPRSGIVEPDRMVRHEMSRHHSHVEIGLYRAREYVCSCGWKSQREFRFTATFRAMEHLEEVGRDGSWFATFSYPNVYGDRTELDPVGRAWRSFCEQWVVVYYDDVRRAYRYVTDRDTPPRRGHRGVL